MKTISFFLPIRKNSKRIKNKSFKKVDKYNLGLTEIKIQQFKKLEKIFNKKIKSYKLEFVVSSDSTIVEKYIKKHSWIKFHKRSKNLATDNSLDKLINIVPKICSGQLILWTHVTSPLFGEKEYLNFIKIFLKSRKKSAFTGTQINTFIFNQTKKKWISHNSRSKRWPRTQDLDKMYLINSAAFIASRSIYIKYKDRIDKNPLCIEIKKENSLDIDNTKDLNEYKKILKK